MITDPDLLLDYSARFTALLAIPAVLTCAVWVSWTLAWGIAVGALVGWLNLWMLARGLKSILARAEEFQGRKRVFPVALFVKWPLILLLLGLAMRYGEARPEGVFIGFLTALIGASVASLQTQPQKSDPL